MDKPPLGLGYMEQLRQFFLNFPCWAGAMMAEAINDGLKQEVMLANDYPLSAARFFRHIGSPWRSRFAAFAVGFAANRTPSPAAPTGGSTPSPAVREGNLRLHFPGRIQVPPARLLSGRVSPRCRHHRLSPTPPISPHP